MIHASNKHSAMSPVYRSLQLPDRVSVGTMGTTYLHLTWQSTIYISLQLYHTISTSTSAPGSHVINLATLKPMATHGLCSRMLAHHAKCAATKSSIPTNRREKHCMVNHGHNLLTPFILRISHGKWHELSCKLILVNQLFGAKMPAPKQQGRHRCAKKKCWPNQLLHHGSTLQCGNTEVVLAASLVRLLGSMASPFQRY